MVEYAESRVEERPAIRDKLFQRASQFVADLRSLGNAGPEMPTSKSGDAPAMKVPPESDERRRTSR
jgi:hypothetical protein